MYFCFLAAGFQGKTEFSGSEIISVQTFMDSLFLSARISLQQMGTKRFQSLVSLSNFVNRQLRSVYILKTVYLVKLPSFTSAVVRAMPQVKTRNTKCNNVYYSEGLVTGVNPPCSQWTFSLLKGLSNHVLIQ